MENFFPVFLDVIETLVDVWENSRYPKLPRMFPELYENTENCIQPLSGSLSKYYLQLQNTANDVIVIFSEKNGKYPTELPDIIFFNTHLELQL